MKAGLIKKVVKKYKPLGIVWGVEFLLAPRPAIELLNDLTKCETRVVGCNCWRFIDREAKDSEGILEIVGGGIDVDHPFENKIEENAQIITEFIAHQLPEDADLVSLIVDDPKIPGPFSYLFRDNKEQITVFYRIRTLIAE